MYMYKLQEVMHYLDVLFSLNATIIHFSKKIFFCMVNALQFLIFHKFIQLILKKKNSHNNAISFFPL